MRACSVLGLGVQALLAGALSCRSTAPAPRPPEQSALPSEGTRPTGRARKHSCALPPFGSPGQPAPSGPARGLTVVDWAGAVFAVSYTFDDSNSSQVSAYPELQALGVPMTFYLQTGKAESKDPVWLEAARAGHELGNHTQNHQMVGSGPDIDAATTFIEKTFGAAPMTMAAPYGDKSYIPLAQERFFINRGTPQGSIAPHDAANPFELPCYVPPTGAGASAFNRVIDAARAAGHWQIVLVHGFTGGTDLAYQPVPLDEFLASVRHAKAQSGVWIDTVVNVGAYYLGQKAVAAARRTREGENETWTWKLPEHFPPDRCVRVVATGGTVIQDGQAVPWDDRGYYEVSLDAGSLTLAP